MKKYKNFNFIMGVILTGLVVLIAIIGCFYTPYDPDAMDAVAKNSGISMDHWMGCDNFGRDIFSRIMEGIRNTFLISLFTVAIGTIVGVLIGGI